MSMPEQHTREEKLSQKLYGMVTRSGKSHEHCNVRKQRACTRRNLKTDYTDEVSTKGRWTSTTKIELQQLGTLAIVRYLLVVGCCLNTCCNRNARSARCCGALSSISDRSRQRCIIIFLFRCFFFLVSISCWLFRARLLTFL